MGHSSAIPYTESKANEIVVVLRIKFGDASGQPRTISMAGYTGSGAPVCSIVKGIQAGHQGGEPPPERSAEAPSI